MNEIHLSIIVPVYNSESFIVQSLERLGEFLSERAPNAELIIVDDGSRDTTREKAGEWAKIQRPYPVRVISLERNFGKGSAVAVGMLQARGKYRIFLDADLAYPPSQILCILKTLEDGSDVAVACRVHNDSRYTISPAFFHYLYTRHLASRLINSFLRSTIIPHCSDSQAGLKGFTAFAAEAIFAQQVIKGFPFDVEVLYLAEKMHMKISEVAVEYRYFNEPTTVVFMQDGLSMARDVLKIHMHNLKGRYKLAGKNSEKKLVVNADDYGMTLAISQGILKTAAKGIVRGASVMPNSPDFLASMDELDSAETKLDIGLHATLTWGRPIADPQKIPALVDKDGKFLPKNALLFRALTGKISEEEVYVELRAQCEKLSARSPKITHLDSHHHVHVFPVICKATERVAREFGIKFVRAPREGIWSPSYSAFAKRLLIALLPASRPAYWRRRGFLSTDRFGGFELGGGKNLKLRWIEAIAALPYGTTEIMVHPGYPSANHDTYNAAREDEITALCDEGVKQKAAGEGVQIGTFKEMA